MDGEQVYALMREIANTDDSTLQELFGTCEMDDIILNHTLNELYSIWAYQEV